MVDRIKPESVNGMGQNMHKKGEANQETYALTRDMILSVLQTDPKLRHRRQLFQDFIDIELPTLTTDSENQVDGFVNKQFNMFVVEKKSEAMTQACDELNAE